jgi:heme-degrading monooxygenase HmoA
MLPSMDDDELNELFRRREACLRDGIPREVYVEAVERAHELRRTAFAAAFQAFLRAFSGGTHTDPSGDDSMIVREWRGWAALSKADDYPKHFRDRVIPELCRLDGFVGVQLTRRRVGDRVEFVALTRWQTMDAIRGFAGPDITKAVVDPAGAAVLIEFDTTVQHYEVVEEAVSS